MHAFFQPSMRPPSHIAAAANMEHDLKLNLCTIFGRGLPSFEEGKLLTLLWLWSKQIMLFASSLTDWHFLF